jgi:uncharacterized oxidoreductase
VPTFASASLLTFAQQLFCAAGVPKDEADIVAGSLVLANLSGHDSHGLIRIPQYTNALRDGRLKAGAAFQVVQETPALLCVDAGWGLGQVQAHRLLERLIPKARQVGLAAGTLKHCGHIGRVGEYAEAAAGHELALVASVTNHGLGTGMAPPGGTVARIGTNPLCIGVPTSGPPVVLDIGTTVCAEGKIRVAFNKGQQVPPGYLIDANGRPTTDPGVLYREPRGSILPLGGAMAYKGFGIGLLLDMLVGGLSGAPCSFPGAPNRSANAVFFLVIDPKLFDGLEHFLREVTGLVETVRTCPRAEGVEEILLPGDPERRERERRGRSGLTLDDGTWKQLVQLADQLGVAVPPEDQA